MKAIIAIVIFSLIFIPLSFYFKFPQAVTGIVWGIFTVILVKYIKSQK